MRIAALYDIHGNLPALDAVLREVVGEQVDLVVVGGDVVPGPMPGECLDRLFNLDSPTRFLVGNGDREVLARMKGHETDWYRNAPEAWSAPVGWSATQLSSSHRDEIDGWPTTQSLTADGAGDVLFCHGTPCSDTKCFTRLTAEELLLPYFSDVGFPLVICGHTHMQFDRKVGATRIVNAGSVGMPFGAPGAFWLMLGPEVELRRTDYDFTEAARLISETSYPQADAFAQTSVLQPPSEEDTLKMFSRAELKE